MVSTSKHEYGLNRDGFLKFCSPSAGPDRATNVRQRRICSINHQPLIWTRNILLMAFCLMATPTWASGNAAPAAGIQENQVETSARMAMTNTQWPSAAERVANFASTTGIRVWQGGRCGPYETSFYGTTAGILLAVLSPSRGMSYSGGCRGVLEHRLRGIPEDLQPGLYVAAVTAEKEDDGLNSDLRVVEVLGTVPDDFKLLRAGVEQICSATKNNRTRTQCLGFYDFYGPQE